MGIKNLKYLVYSALGIALVALSTMIIRIPTIRGYINFGDIMIFTIAVLLGKRGGFIAGALGSALADLLGGYFIYAPATFIIKGIEGFLCGVIFKDNEKIFNITLPLATIIGGLFMVLGYYLYEFFMFGYATAIASVPGNLFQGLVSAIASLPIIIATRKSKSSLNLSR